MKVSYSATFLALVMLMSTVKVSIAVTCNVYQLSPCTPSITTGSPPSPACCAQMKAQQPCLCQYIRDPNYSAYINTPNSRKVASTCGVPLPKC
ncbi:hypothetical protein ACHQM5_009580 [Ranunculus cassubicifolius]